VRILLSEWAKPRHPRAPQGEPRICVVRACPVIAGPLLRFTRCELPSLEGDSRSATSSRPFEVRFWFFRVRAEIPPFDPRNGNPMTLSSWPAAGLCAPAGSSSTPSTLRWERSRETTVVHREPGPLGDGVFSVDHPGRARAAVGQGVSRDVIGHCGRSTLLPPARAARNPARPTNTSRPTRLNWSCSDGSRQRPSHRPTQVQISGVNRLVGVAGFEPAIPSSQTRCADSR
jgi:hypothetical protein